MSELEWPEGTEALLERILTDAYGDDEQLWALCQAFEDGVTTPSDAFVIGEPVEVIEIDYDGNNRRGLTATCRRPNGSEHVVAVSEIVFPEGSDGARHVAAYRKWSGLEPAPGRQSPSAGRPRRHKIVEGDLDLTRPIELVLLAPKQNAVRCRVLGTEREITLRSRHTWDMASGEIVTVHARKQWRYAGHPYLSGDVERHRLDVKELGLVPLRLRDEGPWEPTEQYWGEEGEALEDWEEHIIARGPHPCYEMEQVLPGASPDAWDYDPILEAVDLKDAGDLRGATGILLGMLAADLRCLEAHAHLGNFSFVHHPEKSIRHYEVGTRIGELSLPDGFDGVLPWGLVDNRPFLRCLHGFGLCLWRLGREEEAIALFERMLWLNPTDNQGIRFLLPQIRAGEPWRDDEQG